MPSGHTVTHTLPSSVPLNNWHRGTPVRSHGLSLGIMCSSTHRGRYSTHFMGKLTIAQRVRRVGSRKTQGSIELPKLTYLTGISGFIRDLTVAEVLQRSS